MIQVLILSLILVLILVLNLIPVLILNLILILSLWQGQPSPTRAKGGVVNLDGHMDYRTEAEGYYQHTEETAHFRQARAPPSEKRERRQRERERERERDTERERAREREREVWGGGQREVNGRVTAHNQKIAWGRSSGVKAVQAWGMRHGSWA